MPQYNISVVVDPSGATAGVNVVEQKLAGVKTKADGAKASLQRAFDFNAGPAVAAASSVDKAIETVTAAEIKAAGGWYAWEAANTSATNTVKKNLDTVNVAVPKTAKTVVTSAGQIRASTLQMGQQFNDFSTQVLAGGSVVTAFAQQSGQAAFAMQGMGGKVGEVGKFLAGPWGTIIIIATTLLASFVAKHIDLNSELDKAIDKLKEDAKQTEIDRQAKELYTHSEEGLATAIRDRLAAMDEALLKQRTQGEQDNLLAQTQQNLAKQTRDATKALLEQALARYHVQQVQSGAVGPRGELATLGTDTTSRQVAALQRMLDKNEKDIADADQLFQRSLVELATEAAKRNADPVEAIRQKYEGANGIIASIQKAANADKDLTTNREKQLALTRAITAEYVKERAEIEAAQKAQRETNDGVARFRTRQQAIGIAGRELQQQGFRVDGNVQFGVTGGHANNAEHNQFAIDVNFGKGVREADVPDLKARYDELALLYQSRGFKVLWNGKVYAAGGHGPGGSVGGHQDHMDISAPQTIVGKPTLSSTAAAVEAEFRRAQTEAERLKRIAEAQKDFVQGVVDQAAQKGQGSDKASVLQATIDRVLADFQRRFNQAATPEQKGTIVKSLTEADARETAQHFTDAYITPLERLKALQGTTGQSREILNKQLEESTRLKRELTPVEKQVIENSVKEGDALKLQAQILEEVRRPQEEYAKRVEALNALLAKGTINQTSYNARIADLGATARNALKDIPGQDPNTGDAYSTIAARADEEARFANQLDTLQSNRAQLLALGINWDALEEAAHRDHVNKLNAIDQARLQMAISAGQTIADSLLSIAKDSFGEQSKIYKAMFVVSKAFAIADSIIKIQQAIANALSLPFPANLGAVAIVAAQAASIVANIQAVSLQFADGGLVRGQGSGRSDSITANVSDGEFIVNAESTSRNYALLRAINDNKRMSFANGGVVGAASTGASLSPITTSAANDNGLGAAASALEKAAADLSAAAEKLKGGGGNKVKSILGVVGGFLLGGIGGALLGYALSKADGGLVTGPGGPREDKVPVMASNGEFIVNAGATSRNYALLKAINDNRLGAYAEGGLVANRDWALVKALNDNRQRAEAGPSKSVYGGRRPSVGRTSNDNPDEGRGGRGQAQPAPNVQVPIKVVNVLDKSTLLAALRSEEGTRLILNVISENPRAISATLDAAAA
jgi:hypothetical protein